MATMESSSDVVSRQISTVPSSGTPCEISADRLCPYRKSNVYLYISVVMDLFVAHDFHMEVVPW